MSKIPGTEEIRSFPQSENTLPSEESKKVSWFGSYQATNVIILIFIIIAAAGIITGSISLSEKTEQKTIRNVSSADFFTGPQPSGTNVTQQSDGKYVVSLDYSQPVSGGGYIIYLNSIVAGSAQANRALVLDGGKGISGITSLTSTNIFGKIGSGTSQSDGYFSDVLINRGLSVTSKSFLEGGLSVTGGLSVAGGSYLDGVLVSGDTSTNYVNGTSSAVIGGTNNGISGNSSYSMVGSGQTNTIGVSTSHSFIGGGQTNTIQDLSGFSAIISGENNGISGSTSHSFIGGGQTNTIQDLSGFSAIIAGTNNGISGSTSHSFIASGSGNGISGKSKYSMIGSGQDNTIGVSTSHSFIGGGQTNTIQDISGFSAIIAGQNNTILSNNTVILGGQGLSTATGGSWSHSTLCGKYNDPNFYPWEKSTPQALPGVSYRFAVGSGIGAGVSQLAFAVDNSGNIYYGTDNGASIYQRTGTDQYTPKSFTIQHPTLPNRWLRHGCLEGPEGGVYYRGKGEAPATIRLPDYATYIASDFTVQVTPIGSPRMMSASEVSHEGTFRVYGEGKFHWTAIGERVPLEAEPLKTEVNIHSMGPYSWSV